MGGRSGKEPVLGAPTRVGRGGDAAGGRRTGRTSSLPTPSLPRAEGNRRPLAGSRTAGLGVLMVPARHGFKPSV